MVASEAHSGRRPAASRLSVTLCAVLLHLSPHGACRQRMEGVLAAEGIAESYASKRQFAGSAAAKASAGVADADAAAAAAAKAAADVADEAAWDELIAAAPGPLGVQREQQQQGRSLLGSGLAAPDRQQLQAETAAQEAYIDQVGVAVDALKAISQVKRGGLEVRGCGGGTGREGGRRLVQVGLLLCCAWMGTRAQPKPAAARPAAHRLHCSSMHRSSCAAARRACQHACNRPSNHDSASYSP